MSTETSAAFINQAIQSFHTICFKSILIRLIVFCETRVGDVTRVFKDFVTGMDANKIEIYKDDNLLLLSEFGAPNGFDTNMVQEDDDDLQEIDFN